MLPIQKNIPMPLIISINETLKAMEVGDSISLVVGGTPVDLINRRVKAAAKKLDGRKFKTGNIDISGVGTDFRCWRVA